MTEPRRKAEVQCLLARWYSKVSLYKTEAASQDAASDYSVDACANNALALHEHPIRFVEEPRRRIELLSPGSQVWNSVIE